MRPTGELWDGSLVDWARKVEALANVPAIPALEAVMDRRVIEEGENRYRFTCDQSGCSWTLVVKGENLQAAVINQITLSMTESRGRVPKIPTIRGDDIGKRQRSTLASVSTLALSLLAVADEPTSAGRPASLLFAGLFGERPREG